MFYFFPTEKLLLVVGFLTPLLPLFGSKVLLAFMLILIILTRSKFTRWFKSPLFPLSVLLLVWCLGTYSFAVVNAVELSEELLLNTGNFPDFGRGHKSFLFFLTLFLMAILWSVLRESPKARSGLLTGLFSGALVSAVLTICQINLIGHEYFPNTSEFWHFQGRYSGTFTDPNAFGIFSFLIIGFAVVKIYEKRELWPNLFLILLIVSILGVTVFSGSRSFFIGIFIFLAILWLQSKPRKIYVFGLIGLVGSILGLINIFGQELANIGLPSGLERVLASLNYEKLGEAFFSRQVFWMVGVEAFLDNPLFGIGASSFADLFPWYSSKLGFETANWTDNPNNLYLGILAEFGFLGIVAGLLFLAQAFPFGLVAEKPIKALLYSFGVLLFFGPHIQFLEVAIVSSLLLAYSADAGYGATKQQYKFLAACLLLIPFKLLVHDWGFWGWERAEGNVLYRWTGQRAAGVLECSNNGQAKLKLRGANPLIAQNPVEVKIKDAFGIKTIILNSTEMVEQSLKCSEPIPGSDYLFYTGKIRYTLEVSETWQPSALLASNDRRNLGVQVFE